MAGDWIKMRIDLADDPAVIALAHHFGIDEDTVVGKLHRLWSWANKQTTDGNAPGVTYKWIDKYLGIEGFARALSEQNWFGQTDCGITIPNFDIHNGKSGKQRALTAKRVSSHRHQIGNDGSVTNALAREEKRREEVSPNGDTPLKAPKGAIPKAFEAWWEAYPRKVGKQAALRAWTKAGRRLRDAQGITSAQSVERMQCSAEAFATSPKGRGDFCPHPATWLNQGRYDDDPATWERDGLSETSGSANHRRGLTEGDFRLEK